MNLTVEAYRQALFLDIPTVLICAAILLRFAGLSFAHPGTPYLVFHVHSMTLRLIGLLGGATTLFSYPDWKGNYDPVTPEEIQRATLYADLALCTMTAVWVWFRPHVNTAARKVRSLRLDESIVWPVIVIAFPLGIVGLALGASLPGVDSTDRMAQLGAWSSSSYLLVMQSWSGLALLAYIYCRGFGYVSSSLMALYLVIMGYQGFHRFRVVIPVLVLVQIWLDRRRLRWPPAWIMAGLLVVGSLFFPLKQLGRLAQEGASLSEMIDEVTDSVGLVVSGEAADQCFLDQFASTLTLVDVKGEKYLGRDYLSLLTLPIPRQLWPDKPELAGFMKDISIPSRPMKENGMIATYLGEAYANFGVAGILLIPPILAALLAFMYAKSVRYPPSAVVHFVYVLVSANLIQVYRDGLSSMFVFTFVNMMPLMAIILLHVAFRILGRAKWVSPLGSAGATVPKRRMPDRTMPVPPS